MDSFKEDKRNSKHYQKKIKKGSRKIVKIHQRRRKLITYVLFGRVIVILLLLIFQFAFLFLLGQHFDSFQGYSNKITNILSFLFIIFLVNSKSKPEFKLSWMILVAVAPFFGLFFFLFFKFNVGMFGLKKAIKKTTKSMQNSLLNEKDCEVNQPEQIKDLAFYLKNTGGFPTYQNCPTEYFPSGEDMFKDLLVELQKAEKFIFIEFFIIGMGKVWDSILEILIKKAEKGVEIRIMYDGIGCMMLLPTGYPEYLETLGIKAKVYAPLIPLLSTHQNNRDHRKILIIDGKTAYTGGINLEDEYMNLRQTRFKYWKDSAIKIYGPATKTFTALFLQTWNLSEKKQDDWSFYVHSSQKDLQIEKKSEGFIIPYGDDGLNEENIAELVYCDILNKAHTYVHITSPYVILDNELETALVFAVKRGVKISVIVPAKADHFITFCIGRTFIKTLIDKGVHVYEYMPGFIHEKMFISDDKTAVVGSINLDYRSLFHHFECAAYIYDSPTVSKIEQDFIHTQNNCREITLSEYKKIPVYQKMIGRVARMFAPIL